MSYPPLSGGNYFGKGQKVENLQSYSVFIAIAIVIYFCNIWRCPRTLPDEYLFPYKDCPVHFCINVSIV